MPLTVAWGTPARLAAAQTWTHQLLGPTGWPPSEPEGSAVPLGAQASGGGSGYSLIIMMLVIGAGVYFMMIRPQQRRRREVMDMQSGMGPGDEVVTVGGLYGTIQSLDDETVLLEIAPDVVARYARLAISRVVSPADRTEDEDEDQVDDEGQPVADKAADPD